MAATVRTILDHAETLLDAHAFADYCPIGLQVSGRAEHVDTIATSVSSTRDAFERAAAVGAQLLLVHHGLFWKGMSQVVDPIMRERLAVLIDHDITLAGYHLGLDAHPGIGNNALIADLLELTRVDVPFAVHGGRAIGVVGELPGDGLAPDRFRERVRSVLGGRDPLVLGADLERVRRVAVCSGGAAADVDEAAELGCDAFLTGEPREETDARARELGIMFLAGGHHATEVFGIRALGELLAREFDLRHEFLDADNPV
ncbi:MAG: Nif3-like dinuclear metal center hexameric protein [Thermoleophilia bacterium]|nr:Nif3-like dinuclear metal center hexameric protein [Thermoleophilia bacterium]